MRKMTLVGVVLALLMITSAVVVGAQPATCTPLLERALVALDENCGGIERNSACYGYNRVEATFASADFPAEAFSQPSDIAALGDFSTITTAPLDELADEWGVALMRVQANLPGTLPGQNVTFVLMGDVSLASDEENATESPMQAFYFTTGVGNPNCVDSPNALIVQSPQGEQVELTINGANVSLASTAFLTLAETPGGVQGIELTMAEGEAVINETMIVPEGHWALIPIEDTRLDDTFPVTIADERPACRPTPEIHRDNFEGLLNLLPEVALPEAVDNIDTDERGCHVVHTVGAGENLFRIGLQYDVDFNEIAAYNELPSAQAIGVGQELLIPVQDDVSELEP